VPGSAGKFKDIGVQTPLDVGGMDSIFDDESEGVGSDIEAYCPGPRCKADTNHTIISMYEDEIRRVQCVVCGDVHAFRKPRGEAYEDPVDPPPRKLRKKPAWEEAMSQTTEKEMESCRPYSIRDTYEEGDLVSHPTFHVGFVTDLLPDNKVEITFRDERRILVHNRADLAPKMPAVAEMPVPRSDKKKRKRKTKKDGADGEASYGALSPSDLAEKEAAAERAAKDKLMTERQRLAEKAGKVAGDAKRAGKVDAKAANAKAASARATTVPAKPAAKAGAKPAAKAAPKGKAAAKAKPAAKPAAKGKAAAPARKSKRSASKPAAKAKVAAKKPARAAKPAKAAAKKSAARKPAPAKKKPAGKKRR
jgi:hypothetical protein